VLCGSGWRLSLVGLLLALLLHLQATRRLLQHLQERCLLLLVLLVRLLWWLVVRWVWGWRAQRWHAAVPSPRQQHRQAQPAVSPVLPPSYKACVTR
jgi:membrane protein required for beta-lactamase induction